MTVTNAMEVPDTKPSSSLSAKSDVKLSSKYTLRANNQVAVSYGIVCFLSFPTKGLCWWKWLAWFLTELSASSRAIRTYPTLF